MAEWNVFPFWLNKSEVEKNIYKNTYFIVLFIVGKKNFLALLHIFQYHAIPLSPIRGGKSYTRFAGRTKVNKICVKLKGLCLKWEHKEYKKCKLLNKNGILLPKLFWPTVRKNCSSDREKLLKFEAEGWEFSKF